MFKLLIPGIDPKRRYCLFFNDIDAFGPMPEVY